MAGGKVLYGDKDGNMQPVSLVFRMAGVSFKTLLQFIRNNPDDFILAENPVMEKDRTKAAELLCKCGYPYAALAAGGKLLGNALKKGQMYPCTAMFMTPSSMEIGEICINSTRIAHLDASSSVTASKAMLDLSEQMQIAISYLVSSVPGFEKAVLSSVASRLGIRETGRVIGEYELKQDDVLSGKKFVTAIGQGAHHVDIHGAGTDQVRIPVKNGFTYDIPFDCLLPQYLNNVLVAGRCISSDRGANGSVRVMGTCIVTGQASGVAAAIACKQRINDVRKINIDNIRKCLAADGAMLS